MKRHTVVEKIMGNDLFSAKKELMERASTVAALIYDSKREEIARSIFEAKDKIKMDGEEVKLKKSKKKVDDDEELDEEILDECLAELSEEYDFDISELDEEQLDELSNELLGRYVKKAHQNSVEHGRAARQAAKSGSDALERGMTTKDSNYYKYMMKNKYKHDRKQFKRDKGIAKAVNKITKEETNLQELSKGTMKSYVDKSSSNERVNKSRHNSQLSNFMGSLSSGDSKGMQKAGKKADDIGRNIHNRQKGQKLANNKLKGNARVNATEETDKKKV